MDFGTIWAWLGDTENQKTLAWMGGGLVAIATIIWKAFKTITKREQAATTPAQNNSNNNGQQVNVGTVSGGSVNVNQQ
jgi:hypothetical protein